MTRRSTWTYRHTLVTRITHATFFIAFLGLVASGFQIYFHLRWLHVNVGALHQYFGLLMIASGLVYLAGGIFSGSLWKLLFGPGDARGLMPMIAYYLKLRPTAPAFTDYNPLQKLAYTTVLLTMGPLMAATGLALWPHLAIFRPITQFFGGRKDVTLWHLGFGLELVLFFIGHMVMVATTGLRNNLRAIVTGWFRVGVNERAHAICHPEQPLALRARASSKDGRAANEVSVVEARVTSKVA
jgi:thiosulfate reductase cytochrome b subunit